MATTSRADEYDDAEDDDENDGSRQQGAKTSLTYFSICCLNPTKILNTTSSGANFLNGVVRPRLNICTVDSAS